MNRVKRESGMSKCQQESALRLIYRLARKKPDIFNPSWGNRDGWHGQEGSRYHLLTQHCSITIAADHIRFMVNERKGAFYRIEGDNRSLIADLNAAFNERVNRITHGEIDIALMALREEIGD